jgi:hypothetical protein
VCLAEQLERLASVYEIHLFSTAVQDLNLTEIHWHRIPALPGPDLIGYLWWFVANHVARWWHKRFKDLATDLTYSPGINCFDADVISVHIVFAEFYRRVGRRLPSQDSPMTVWPVDVSRRAGVSELLHHGSDGFILEDPTNTEELAGLIQRLQQDEGLRKRLGENARLTAERYTWDCNASQLRDLFEEVLRNRDVNRH